MCAQDVWCSPGPQLAHLMWFTHFNWLPCSMQSTHLPKLVRARWRRMHAGRVMGKSWLLSGSTAETGQNARLHGYVNLFDY